MRKIARLSLLVSFLASCEPVDHRCAEDGKRITELDSAYVVGLRRGGEQMDPMHLGEQKYDLMTVRMMADQEHVPVADIALGYQERLFCSEDCASSTLAQLNSKVDSVVNHRWQLHIADSLVMDSIHEGLIK